MEYGFYTVASAIPSVRVADCDYNLSAIESIVDEAVAKGVGILAFPELCITGYTCQDLFLQDFLIDKAEDSVRKLMDYTVSKDIILVVGVPVRTNGMLLNCAAVLQKGTIVGMVVKKFLPNYNEFYEKRWFSSSDDITDDINLEYAGENVRLSARQPLFQTHDGVVFGVELCEDLWSPLPPSTEMTLAGADIIVNLSASDELIGKHEYLLSLVSQQSARLICGYVYSGCGFGESTQDVVYGGNALIFENGAMLAASERFVTSPQLVVSQIDVERIRGERRRNTSFAHAMHGMSLPMVKCKPSEPKQIHTSSFIRKIDRHPFIPHTNDMTKSCNEIFNIQVAGLAKRLVHTNCHTVVVGVSGGLDSTLALLVCTRTFDKIGYDRKGIVGVTMPGFGTTDRTYNNAISLMRELGVTIKEINISDSVIQHFKDIGHDASIHDVTYENCQARERTQILMDLSNKLGGMVVGTGDLSELALGWATYNGDHMSMYGVNVSIPKTLIRHLVGYVANNEVGGKAHETLMDIIDTPISPELIPADDNGEIKQKTEDLVGPYELHDFFIFYTLRYGFSPKKVYFLCRQAFDGDEYSNDTIKHWLKVFYRRFFTQQFKRSCLPDGPKVGSVSLSPRGDWRMPSDASYNIWLKECECL
ncbi:MAG: NAD(+) synthase [Prevotella sp.]|mgnify:CR=1 FL=1|nr:NAD(+) synthase [Prevotella sp.]